MLTHADGGAGTTLIRSFPSYLNHLFSAVCHKHGEAPPGSGADGQGRDPVCGH